MAIATADSLVHLKLVNTSPFEYKKLKDNKKCNSPRNGKMKNDNHIKVK